MDEYDASDRFDLERVMAIARRRWWLVVLCAVAGACAAFAFSATQQKQYTATASLLLRDDGLEQAILPTAVYSQTVDPTREAETNIDLVSSAPVTNRAAAALHMTPAIVASEVAVSADGATNLVSVNATDPNPRVAATLANAYAAQAISFRRRTDQAQVIETQRGVQSQLDAMTRAGRASANGQLLESRNEALKALVATATGDIQLIQPAGIPSAPSAPRTKRSVALGLLFGLLLGMAAAALAERLDRRVREPEELADIYGLPILARIPRIRATRDGGETLGLQGGERDAFRMLLTRLRHTTVDSRFRAVVVTSASADEGKSTIAWHLAETAALAGQRVLLVEAAGMHALVVAARHGLRAGPGFGDVLAERSPVNDAIQPVPIESDGGVALSTERRAIGAEFGTATNGNPRRELVTTRQHRSLSQPSGAEPARVDVMVSGLPMQDPTSLIESDQMTELLLTLADDYDFVVFDSGSALLDPDAISLMKMVGRALIVGRLGVTSRDQAEMFRDDLRLLQVPTLGVIVNDTQPVSRRRAVLARRSLTSGPVPTPSRLTQRSPSEQRSRADRDRAAAGRARRRADRAREDHADATSE